MLKENLVKKNIDLGNIVTVVGKGPFWGMQGQVEVICNENEPSEEIIIKVGPRDDFILSRCSEIKNERIFVQRNDLRKDFDWNAWNKAVMFFGPVDVKELHFFERPFVPENGYCMRENCFAMRRHRIVVMDKSGRVIEYEVCRECRDFWEGLSNVNFPAKKEHRIYFLRKSPACF